MASEKGEFYDDASPSKSQIEESNANYTTEGLQRRLKARHVQVRIILLNVHFRTSYCVFAQHRLDWPRVTEDS